MFKIKSKDVAQRNFVVVIATFFSFMLFIENLNGRFWLNDFKVMYLAAETLVNGDEVYGVSFGLTTGFYKYSPFTLLLFLPYTLFAYKLASIFHFIIIAVSSIGTVILLEKIVRRHLFFYGKKKALILLAVIICIILHLVRELHLGNINMILLFMLCLSLNYTLQAKPIKSGLLLAIVIMAKPYFIICLLPFLLQKKKHTILSTFGFLGAFTILSVLLIGPVKGIDLYFDWFTAMLEHTNYLSSNHTIFALLNQYIGTSLSPNYAFHLFGFIGIVSFLFFWKLYKTDEKASLSAPANNRSLIVYFFFLIAVIPSILITDSEHFLFSLPLISIMVFYLVKKKNLFLSFLFILLIFLYEGDSKDLLGRTLSHQFEDFGLLGIGNILIISISIFLFAKYRKHWQLKEE